MPKRRTIVFLLVAVALLVGVFLFATRSREPNYQGKDLNFWVSGLVTDRNPRGEPEAIEAIKKIGTNAVPFLVAWVREGVPGDKETTLDRIKAHLPWRFTREAYARNRGARGALKLLGSNAVSALPELTRIMNSPDVPIASDAAEILPYLGTQAIPAIATFLTNQHVEEFPRIQVIPHLQALGTNALPLVPRLIDCLHDPNDQLADRAARELGRWESEGPTVIPALQAAMADRRVRVSCSGLRSLIRLAHSNPQAMQALRTGLTNRYGDIRREVTNALLNIAPELLPNAPPKSP